MAEKMEKTDLDDLIDSVHMAEKMKKKDLPPTLPKELMVQILLRLPVRTLLDLKCVCKTWCSLISNPEFAKSHFELAVAPTYRLFLNSMDAPQVTFADMDATLNDNDSPSKLVIRFPPSSLKCMQRATILGSCRGFVLVTNDNYDHFVVWNPLNGVHKRINNVPLNHETLFTCMCGLGYDSSTDDYVIVNIILSRSRSASSCVEIRCFSLRKNLWSRICDDGDFVLNHHLAVMLGSNSIPLIRFRQRQGFSCGHQGDRQGLFLNGALHWLLLQSSEKFRCVIVGFDVTEKRLSEIPVPHDEADGFDATIYDFRVIGECLSVASRVGYGTTIWTMKEYKVHSSWTKSFVLLDDNPPQIFFPICFSKNDKLLGYASGGFLMRYNDKGKLVEHCPALEKKVDRYSKLHCGVYRESLLSLPG